MFTNPIDQAAIAFVQALIKPEFGVRVLGRRRDVQQLPAAYYRSGSVSERGFCYTFWLSDGNPRLLIHVAGLGVYEAAYEDEWPIVLALGFSYAQAA